MSKTIKDYVREMYNAYEATGQKRFYPGDMHMPADIEDKLNSKGVLDSQDNVAGSAYLDPAKALEFLIN